MLYLGHKTMIFKKKKKRNRFTNDNVFQSFQRKIKFFFFFTGQYYHTLFLLYNNIYIIQLISSFLSRIHMTTHVELVTCGTVHFRNIQILKTQKTEEGHFPDTKNNLHHMFVYEKQHDLNEWVQVWSLMILNHHTNRIIHPPRPLYIRM